MKLIKPFCPFGHITVVKLIKIPWLPAAQLMSWLQTLSSCSSLHGQLAGMQMGNLTITPLFGKVAMTRIHHLASDLYRNTGPTPSGMSSLPWILTGNLFSLFVDYNCLIWNINGANASQKRGEKSSFFKKTPRYNLCTRDT